MISIHRNCDTKKLEIMLTSDGNTSYVTYDDATNSHHLHQMIGSCAQAMGMDWDSACEEFDAMWCKLQKLSKERKRRLSFLKPDDVRGNDCVSFEYIYLTLLAGGVLTLHEIFWLDYYVRKHKLLQQIG